MKLPKMVLFDYGQTLINEQKFNPVKGTEAVLKYTVKNKYNLTLQMRYRGCVARGDDANMVYRGS